MIAPDIKALVAALKRSRQLLAAQMEAVPRVSPHEAREIVAQIDAALEATLPSAGEQGKPSEGQRTGSERPKRIVLCGSSRFIQQMAVCAWLLEREEGAITLGMHLLPDWYPNVPADHLAEAEGIAEKMDALHLRKIDLADEIFVVDVGGYIGSSTSNEIAYAERRGIPVRRYSTEGMGFAVETMLADYRAAALTPTGSGEVEPVAWRWRVKIPLVAFETRWVYSDTQEQVQRASDDGCVVEPLFRHPPASERAWVVEECARIAGREAEEFYRLGLAARDDGNDQRKALMVSCWQVASGIAAAIRALASPAGEDKT